AIIRLSLASPGMYVSRLYSVVSRMLQNGKKLDSSGDRNKPFWFKIGRKEVIKGFEEGVTWIQINDSGLSSNWVKGVLGHSVHCNVGKTKW
uniref:peptidylprolyl isomerase n=1 Tax=Pavo cristatus TaxID=9049 RepID=A0A8C9L6R0_PAVCR